MHVDPHELRAQIAAYQKLIREASRRRRRYVHRPPFRNYKPRGSRVPERLGELLLSIATHLAERPNFANYTYKEDFISAACVDMIRACAVFDLSRGTSAFSYLTQAAWWAFTHIIRRENRRGISGGDRAPVDVTSLPGLTLGLFDAQALQSADFLRGSPTIQPE